LREIFRGLGKKGVIKTNIKQEKANKIKTSGKKEYKMVKQPTTSQQPKFLGLWKNEQKIFFFEQK
jgi:hypothetical protein